MILSDCCGATISGEVSGEGKDAVGICSDCGEWANVYDDEEEVSLVTDLVIRKSKDSGIGIINDEDELEDLNEDLDPYQAEEGKISLLKLIEDEILLGLPLSPLHEEADCPATESFQEYTATKENPFAVLKTLKPNKS